MNPRSIEKILIELLGRAGVGLAEGCEEFAVYLVVEHRSLAIDMEDQPQDQQAGESRGNEERDQQPALEGRRTEEVVSAPT